MSRPLLATLRFMLAGILVGGATCLAIVLVLFAWTGNLEAFERPMMWVVGSLYGIVLGGISAPLLWWTILKPAPLWRSALVIGSATWIGAVLCAPLRSTGLGAFAGFATAVTWLALGPLLRVSSPSRTRPRGG